MEPVPKDVFFGRERAESFFFSHPEWAQELWKPRVCSRTGTVCLLPGGGSAWALGGSGNQLGFLQMGSGGPVLSDCMDAEPCV